MKRFPSSDPPPTIIICVSEAEKNGYTYAIEDVCFSKPLKKRKTREHFKTLVKK